VLTFGATAGPRPDPGDALVTVKINSLRGGELVHFTMPTRRFRNLRTRAGAKG